MDRFELVLARKTDLDSEGKKQEYIDSLESYILDILDKYNDNIEVVSDSIFDTLIDILKEVAPDSDILKHVWSKDFGDLDEDLDSLLINVPMLSICTIKNVLSREFLNFKDRFMAESIFLCASIKLNGHGVRVVYKDGYLVRARSRGRSTNGRDLTRHLKLILGDYNSELAGFGLVELRGEVLLPFSNFDKAREFNPKIKSAFSGVASLIKDSASDDEVLLLKFVAYDIIFDTGVDLPFEDLSGKFSYLESCDFEVPLYFTVEADESNFDGVISDLMFKMDNDSTDYDYFTDGVVVSVDDIGLFNSFGCNAKYRYGNIAMKILRWAQDGYTGVVESISWEYGKKKKTPVAIIEGTLTCSGNTVHRVPLYAPYNILLLDAYPGNIIHFKYGGESGVVPTTADGRLVTDSDVRQSYDFSYLDRD